MGRFALAASVGKMPKTCLAWFRNSEALPAALVATENNPATTRVNPTPKKRRWGARGPESARKLIRLSWKLEAIILAPIPVPSIPGALV